MKQEKKERHPQLHVVLGDALFVPHAAELRAGGDVCVCVYQCMCVWGGETEAEAPLAGLAEGTMRV
jgi:hypothetical protein